MHSAKFRFCLHASVTTFSAMSTCPKADFGPGMGYAYYESADGCGVQRALPPTSSQSSELLSNPNAALWQHVKIQHVRSGEQLHHCG